MSVTYCVVVPFDRIAGGNLVPGEAQEAPSMREPWPSHEPAIPISVASRMPI